MNKRRKELKVVTETKRYVHCPKCGYDRFPVNGLLGFEEASFLGYDNLYCHACSHAFGLSVSGRKVEATNIRPHYKPGPLDL